MSQYWMNTATGRRFDLFDFTADDIDIIDIGIALGNQCRYAGHTRRHYSVAEHSLIISHAARPENAAWGLMHDAAEAYVTDIPWPLKAAGLVTGLQVLEKRIMAVICQKFGLSSDEPSEIKELDLEILDLESQALLVRHPDWDVARVPREVLRKAWHAENWALALTEPLNSYTAIDHLHDIHAHSAARRWLARAKELGLMRAGLE